MRTWFRGKGGGLVAFLIITALVAGGLGWATMASLQLERAQLETRAQAEIDGKLRLALWRLDSLVSPALARENSRPYNHYSAVYAPSLALRNDGNPWPAGTVLEPSPLLSEELPDWILLHFQAAATGWASPQVLSPALTQSLNNTKVRTSLVNVQPTRAQVLTELARQITPQALHTLLQERGSQLTATDTTLLPANRMADNPGAANFPVQQGAYAEYQNRAMQQALVQQPTPQAQQDPVSVVLNNTIGNGENWLTLSPLRPIRPEQVQVTLGPLRPLWLTASDQADRLLLARVVQVGSNHVCQGILLDWPRVRTLLAREVSDLFPEARMEPVRDDVPAFPERTMAALPVLLDPDSSSAAFALPAWTPLRVGLACAWLAALVALTAVGLGGWSLIDLSQRRFRFVSAVTHELRTPLTTLRLYLDMLAGGLVTGEQQQHEYLQTLNAEADRLNRLVGNVLDFSRLENQRPRLAKTRVALTEVLEQARSTWQGRCQACAKDLVIENTAGENVLLFTDVQLVQQILGNLIDNACKYSREALDPRIWLRARGAKPGRLVLEVEDRGPGVLPRDRRAIFRAFRRGRGADVTAGGVGLGLALAQSWAHMLDGSLTLQCGQKGVGACFRFEIASRLP